MGDEVKTYLSDIKQAIAEINSFLPVKKDFFEFKKDLKTRRAIERNIEIIGEAAKRIITIDPNIKITDIKKIIDTRNRIIHGYDSVSEDVIWSIIIRNIPVLEAEINSLLAD